MEARSVPDGIVSLLEEHRLTASDAVPIAEASGRHGWWQSDLKDRADLRNTRPASAKTVAAVLRTALDRQPETRGVEVTVEPPDHDDPACPWMKATADGFAGRILTGSYAKLLDCSNVFARILQGRRNRAEREAAIARHPCCVCLVAQDGQCIECKRAQYRDGAPAETVRRSDARPETDADLRDRILAKIRAGSAEPWSTPPTGTLASESAAGGGGGGGGSGLMIRNRFDVSPEGLPVPLLPGSVASIRAAVLAVPGVESCEAERTSPSHLVLRVRGGDGLAVRRAIDDTRTLGCSVEIRHSTPGRSRRVDDPGPAGLRALENAAESLGVQMRTELPEGWSWNPAYSCCADGPGRTWALVESHEGHPAKGSIGTHNDLPAPPDVLAALVTEARRLGIPVKWEHEPGDVVVTMPGAEMPPNFSQHVGKPYRVDDACWGGDGVLLRYGHNMGLQWPLDCLRPATTAEAARA